MPPKKNVTKTGEVPKIPKAKVPRIKKEKPKLKIPSVISVKIARPGISRKGTPTNENVINTVNTEVPSVIPATKLDRINEVARAQLVKGSPVNIEMVIPEKKKRGRKKKIQPENVSVAVARAQLVKGSPVNIEMVIPEKKKRGRKKKIQPENVTVEVAASAGAANDCPENTEKEAIEKRKRVWRKKKIEPDTVAASAGVAKDSAENSETVVVEKKRRVWKKKLIPEPEPDTDPDNSGEVIPKKKIKAPPKFKPLTNGLVKIPKVPAVKNPKQTFKSTKPVLRRRNSLSKVNGTVKKKTIGKAIDEESNLTSPSTLSQREEQTIKTNAELLVSSTEFTAIGSTDICKDKKTPITRTFKRKYLKRKMGIDEDSTITSPSILSLGLLDKMRAKEIQKPHKMASESIQNLDSRRTSMTSNSEWSWTKDISGSSTTTCITVASNDLVRIDGKLPIIKLNNCDALVPTVNNPVEKEDDVHSLSENVHSPSENGHSPSENGHSLSEDGHSLSEDSSSSSSSSSSDSSISSTKTMGDNCLNLSTSSVSPVKLTPHTPPSHQSATSGATKQLTTLEKLSLTLRRFDLGFHAWDENDAIHLTQMETHERTMFKVMSEEHSVLLDCNLLSEILSNKCVVSEKTGDTAEAAEKETDFAKPSAGVVANKSGHEAPRRRDSMAYDPNDDDDALSIFAESLTGFDSRVSSAASIAPDVPAHEEYIPRPVRDTWAPVERTYRPSRIDDLPPNTKKPVCEKQNADSTSLHKDPGVTGPDASQNVVEKSLIVGNEMDRRRGVAWDQWRQLTISTFLPQQPTSSLSLRGVCFFNLFTTCKKHRCTFPHRVVGELELSGRLVKLSEKHFIQEYLLIAKYASLRIKYMGCFVTECQRRELPKILVEMVIVYIYWSNPRSQPDVKCKVDAIESTLLYLNTVNLSVCEDSLKYRFNDGKYLCDVFMETIAHTQNFWRFKPVFLALASFMVREKRTFALKVAAHILERVCIFKFEPPLALVLLSIIELTDHKIFENAMIGTFEKQLQSYSKELHERFLAAKARSAVPLPESPARSSLALSQEPELPSTIAHSDPDNRYTSPDTTNLDNLNKPTPEPIITRTINLDKIRSLPASTPQNNNNNSNNNNNNSNNNYINRQQQQNNRGQQDWNNRTIYDRIPRFNSLMLGPRHQLKRPLPRQVLYGPRPCKYPRRSGPDFYGNQ